VILLSPLAALAASPPVAGAVVREQLAYDPIRDFALEDYLTNSIYARAFGRIETDRGDLWFFEGRFQNHVTMRDLNVSPATLDAHLEAWQGLGLGETGWDGRIAGPVNLRVGALVERWGQLSVLSVADVLNPNDLRVGLLTPPEYLKIPVPMAIVGIGAGKLRFETVLVPFAGRDRLFLRETNWGPVRQDWTSGLIYEIKGWGEEGSPAFQTQQSVLDSLRALTIDMDPSSRRSLDEALLDSELPQAFWGNGEIAQRVEIEGRNALLAVMGGSLRSNQPLTSINEAVVDILRTQTLPEDQQEILELQETVLGNLAEVRWPRTWVAGAEGSALVGPLQVSAETLWTQRSIVRLSYGRATTTPSLGVGLGLLYARDSSFTVTVEGRYLHLFDPPEELLLSRPDHVQVAALARWTLARGRLTLQAGGMFDPTFRESAGAGPAVTWRATDHVQLELGGVVLLGSSPAPEGLLGAADPGTDALTYAGGPVSFIQNNDAVTLAVQFIR
jgi:hypothetical protein